MLCIFLDVMLICSKWHLSTNTLIYVYVHRRLIIPVCLFYCCFWFEMFYSYLCLCLFSQINRGFGKQGFQCQGNVYIVCIRVCFKGVSPQYPAINVCVWWACGKDSCYKTNRLDCYYLPVIIVILSPCCKWRGYNTFICLSIMSY